MKILVLNCGSSSIKYQLLDMDNEKAIAKGLVERIGLDGSKLTHKANKEKYVIEQPIAEHVTGIQLILKALTDKDMGVITTIEEIKAVGHRTTHGGEKFSESVKVDDAVLHSLDELSELAPLHNPPQIKGIKAIQEVLPNVPNVSVFDTAFHSSMPPEAYMYAIPYKYYTDFGIRRYGFHGHSHQYVSKRAAEMLGKDIKDLKIITCHLGNGASLAAVKNGVSIDTSMGFTPLPGLVMGTRCGDIDPAIIFYLSNKENIDCQELDSILNKESGALGLSGISSDFRDLEEASSEGNQRAKMTLDIFHYRIKGYIGKYVAAMNGVDAIVFTAGIGENSVHTRSEALKDLDFLGIKIDPEKNKTRGEEKIISADDSKVKVMVIPTNEELVIARETLRIVE
ncbi:acetate kinase [Clostridia bacterium]|nr:acetate kinase [Clostridia bacterium]